MQLGAQGKDGEVSGGISTPKNYRIAATAISFDIMSNGLYSRKIEAVIRELSCNAYDAHVAAGKKHEPFEVQLPTQFEPIFKIKDYGTGFKFIKGGCEECNGTGIVGQGSASETYCEACDATGDYDAVMRLGCTYFASDKHHSNELIGALGLGSKSPFAYINKHSQTGDKETGGFNIANHYEGKTYFYTARVKDGFPATSLDMVVDSPDVPNGVEIKFPVASGDIWEFENTAKTVFEFFQPKPVFIGEKSVSVNVSTYSVQSELWGMRTNAQTAQGGYGLRAISGVVPYSVGNIDQSRLSDAQKKLVEMPIDLFFNIGDLNVAANRENLQLDPKTVTNILARLDVVQDKLMEEVKAKVDACPTGWEARLKIHELMMQSGLGALVNDAFNKGMLDGKYKSFKLKGAKVAVNELDYNNITAIEFRHNDRAKRKAKKEALFETADNFKRVAALRDVAAGVSKKSDYEIKFEVNERTVFVIHDIARGSADKYVNFMLQNDRELSAKYSKAIVLQRVNKAVSMNRAGDEAISLLDSIGNPPALKASDLKVKYDPQMKQEKAEQVIRRERMSIRQLHRYAQNTRRNTGWKKQWKKGDDNPLLNDFSATKFYVAVVNGGEPVNVVGNFYYGRTFVEFVNEVRDGRTFVEFVNEVRDSDLFPEIDSTTPIFGIKVGSKLLADPNYIEFTSFVKARVAAELTPAKQMAMSLTVKPFSSEWKPVLEYVVEHPMVLSVDSPVRQFAMLLHKAEQTDRAGFVNLSTLAKHFGITIDNTADFSKAWEKVYRQYPILKICDRKSYGSCTIEEKTIMVDYIRSVDEQRKRLVLTNNVIAIDEEREVVNA